MGSYNRNTCEVCGCFIYDADTFCDQCEEENVVAMTTAERLRSVVENLTVKEWMRVPASLRAELEAFMA